MKQLLVLVDGIEPHGYSVRAIVDGFKPLAENRFDTLTDALWFAHMAFCLPVIFGQLSDGHVADLYQKLAGPAK